MTKLKVIYTSDLHGHAPPVNYATNKKEPIGLTAYASVVKETRKENEHTLVIDNGDLIQGTPFMTHYVKEHAAKENPMIGVMNNLNIDAAILGNHEFNFGKEILNTAVKQSTFPWLAANILNAETKKPHFGPAYKIKKITGKIKVAIIGVTTHYIPNWESPEHIKGLEFADAFQTLKYWVEYVKNKEQPDIIIGSYHGGFERDLHTGKATEALTGENQGYQMCMEIPDLGVLLTGHQHRVIEETINNVLVLQPGNNGKFYGEVDFTLEEQDNELTITEKKGSIKDFTAVSADSQALDYLADLEASTQEWLREPIGKIIGDMTIADPFEARVRKHPFIQFNQNVQMEASGADISVTSLLSNTSKGFGPLVTMRDIVSNYMYPNTLVILKLTGAAIKEALEKTATYFAIENEQITVNPAYVDPKPQHYNYDMWEGLDYMIKVGAPAGNRVKNLSYQGKALQADESYEVVLNNYRASGGGNYTMFQDKPVVREIQQDTVELIRAYFERHPIVKAYTIDNFKVIK